MDPKGKYDSEGKDGEWDSKMGKTLGEVEEGDRDASASHYSSKTAREERWGQVNRRRDHSYRQWQSANGWEYVDGAWKWKPSPRTEGKPTIIEDTRKL